MNEKDRVHFSTTVTHLIEAIHTGNLEAREKLSRIIAPRLVAAARRRLGRLPPGQTLLPEDIAQEVWIEILGGDLEPTVRNRKTLALAIATETRDHIVETQRAKHAQKRLRRQGSSELPHEPIRCPRRRARPPCAEGSTDEAEDILQRSPRRFSPCASTPACPRRRPRI